MPEVIVYQNPTGSNVCVCSPVDSTVEELLPTIPGGILMQSEDLPLDRWFDAWELLPTVPPSIQINLTRAKQIAVNMINANAVQVAQKRSSNASIGLPNDVSDADFIASIDAKRVLVNAAVSIDELSSLDL